MVNEGFCGPCQRMLADKEPPIWLENKRPHHQDGESFQQALEMGCHICYQSWTKFDRPGFVGPTSYYMHGRDPSDPSDIITLAIGQDIPSQKLLLEGFQVGASESDASRWGVQSTYFNLQPWYVEHAQMIATGCATNEANTWLSDNTGSDRSFAFLASKYKHCISRHQKCSRLHTGRSLPTRLLDVGKEEVGTIHLVDRESILPDATYSTLSHCWGLSVPLKLTRLTEATLHSGIAVSELPKTFQHAVVVARKLSIQYLWIDSLCIYQDSIDDWSIEATAMQEVYQNAMLNIAATAASDGHVGLFHHRNPREVESFKVDVAWPVLTALPGVADVPSKSFFCAQHRYLRECIDEAPLNVRAWVMQERLLSRRIVHYTSKELYWECYESFASECYEEEIPPERIGGIDWSPRSLKLLLDSTVETSEGESHCASNYEALDKKSLYAAWETFRFYYSGCALTRQEDRLVAFAGIVRKLSGILQDELVAGLWRSRLIKELCWHTLMPSRSSRSDTWLAPSWSWASCTGTVMKYVSEWLLDVAEVVHVDAQAEPSGALKTGVLTLRCRPVAALLERSSQEVLFRDGRVRQKYTGFELRLDDSIHTQGQHDIFLVVLMEFRSHSLYTQICGIILISSAKESTAFERIGMFDMDFNGGDPLVSLAGQIYVRYKDAEEQVIRII